MITDFLNILDDLERTVQAANTKHQDYEAFLKGIQLVMKHILEMLKRNDVRPMDTVGKPFDPHCHEVLMQEESTDRPDGTVLEEFQKGYRIGDRVVRTAKVKVAVNKGN
jgi:molecular chaperone GrpE